MLSFHGISTAITASGDPNHLDLITSVLCGTDRKNLAIIPEKSWDIHLDLNSPSQIKTALKQLIRTIHEAAKLQRKHGQIKNLFILGKIKGFNLVEHFFKKLNISKQSLEKFLEHFENQIIFLQRNFLWGLSKDFDFGRYTKKTEELKAKLTPIKARADQGEVAALQKLKKIATDFAKNYGAKSIEVHGAENCASSKFILVWSPLAFIFDWFDLREIFSEQLKKTLGITGNIVVKKIGDPKDRSYSDVARAFILDQMDLYHSSSSSSSTV